MPPRWNPSAPTAAWSIRSPMPVTAWSASSVADRSPVRSQNSSAAWRTSSPCSRGGSTSATMNPAPARPAAIQPPEPAADRRPPWDRSTSGNGPGAIGASCRAGVPWKMALPPTSTEAPPASAGYQSVTSSVLPRSGVSTVTRRIPADSARAGQESAARARARTRPRRALGGLPGKTAAMPVPVRACPPARSRTASPHPPP